MTVFWRFVVAMVVAVIAIFLGVILGDYGPWYLSWLLGTGFMILVAATGAVLFEEQSDKQQQKKTGTYQNRISEKQRPLEY
ncbi:hypothetical protein ACFO1V_13075 [Daeguia caeni]|uniref:Uncharacterized protein n=1 Tax=Daeguia caeni TaxID=439612 RepID=A0ABV9H8B1_9HYPH